jgi:ribosomal protein L11 methyltransferase
VCGAPSGSAARVIRLAVRCRPELAERVLAELIELAPGGVEEEQGSGHVEYAIYGAEGELPALPDLRAAAGDGLIDLTTSEVPEDWADRWRDFHRPILVGGRVWIRPSWERARTGAVDLVVDPGAAFGTGAHPTTRLCVELLLELERAGEAGGPLADWGTGSGVLAIAAAKLGWAPVAGCDHERTALEAAAANAEANDVHIDLRRVNLRRDPPPLAPTVVANLTAPVLRPAAEALASVEVPKRPRSLVCSGLLAAEADEISAALARAGMDETTRRTKGDWVALLAKSGS